MKAWKIVSTAQSPTTAHLKKTWTRLKIAREVYKTRHNAHIKDDGNLEEVHKILENNDKERTTQSLYLNVGIYSKRPLSLCIVWATNFVFPIEYLEL